MAQTILSIVKILLALCLLVFAIFDYIKKRKTAWIGIYMIATIVTTPAHWLSFIFSAVLAVLWLSFVINTKWSFTKKLFNLVQSNKSAIQNFVYYVIPLLIFIISYTVPLFILYGEVAFLVNLQVYEVFFIMLIIDILLYCFMHIKYPIIYLCKKKKDKSIKLKDVYNENPMNILVLVVLTYLPFIMM